MRPAGAVVIGCVHAHGPARFSVLGESDSGGEANVFERAVTVVSIKPVGLRIVGLKNIRPAVLIEVENGDAERFARFVVDPCFYCRVFKLSRPQITVEPRGEPVIRLRRAVGFCVAVERAPEVVFGCPLHVIGDEHVEVAVLVVVKPGGAGSESRVADAGVFRGIGESTLAFIPEKPVTFEGCDIEVLAAVVVIVAGGNAHAVHFDVQPSFGGDVGKSSVLIVAVEF